MLGHSISWSNVKLDITLFISNSLHCSRNFFSPEIFFILLNICRPEYAWNIKQHLNNQKETKRAFLFLYLPHTIRQADWLFIPDCTHERHIWCEIPVRDSCIAHHTTFYCGFAMQKKIAEEREIKAWIFNLIRTARLWDTTKFQKLANVANNLFPTTFIKRWTCDRLKIENNKKYFRIYM